MKKVFDGILVLLIILSIAALCGAEWINNNKDKHFSYNTTYLENSDVPDDSVAVDQKTKFAFNLKYFANHDNSGAEMLELNITYYTDINLQDVYSLGIQIINPGDLKLNIIDVKSDDSFSEYNAYYSYAFKYNNAKVAFFQTDDGVSFKSTTTFNERQEPFILKIDEKPYAFDFEKQFKTEKFMQFLWKNGYRHYVSSFDYFLYMIYDSTSKIVDGQGIYTNLKAELNNVFNIYEYNENSGKFDLLTNYGYSATYVPLHITYFDRGAMTHEDSMFGRIGHSTPGGVIWAN